MIRCRRQQPGKDLPRYRKGTGFGTKAILLCLEAGMKRLTERKDSVAAL